MKVLKGYVKNTARPEGCISECYIQEECMKYCSNYVEQAKDIGERPTRNEQSPTSVEGRPLSKGVHVLMPQEMLKIAHRYVLFNTSDVGRYEE